MENQTLSQLAYDITTITLIIVLLGTIFLLAIFTFWYYNNQDKQTKEFISMLDEKEKALILNYEQAKKVIFKKTHKKQ